MIRDAYPVVRLMVALALMTIGSGAMYVVVVVLPTVQAEFGVARADASLPYTLTMLGFGAGGILMGRLADRHGIVVPTVIGALGLGSGYIAASMTSSLWSFALVHGLVLGLLGSSATFSPLIADISMWFERRRGIAVAICASGNYLAGAVWPQVIQRAVEAIGWRDTYFWIGLFCTVTMLPLSLLLRRRPPALSSTPAASATASAAPFAATSTKPADPGVAATVAAARMPVADPTHRANTRPIGMASGPLITLLCIAGVACCVAMSMPQVHIVAYCSDLGFGVARGSEMLSLMLGFGIVSRIVSGLICDRIGGLKTLLLGSVMQCVALLLFLPSDSVMSLYVVSILFGLFQGGIVPSYAIIVRENFPATQTGTKVGFAITATLFGMAFGGWLSGKIFDLSGSYQAAFVNGIGWNLLNIAIVVFLIMYRRGMRWGPPRAAVQ